MTLVVNCADYLERNIVSFIVCQCDVVLGNFLVHFLGIFIFKFVHLFYLQNTQMSALKLCLYSILPYIFKKRNINLLSLLEFFAKKPYTII